MLVQAVDFRINLAKITDIMLSRVAESIYWMSRYVERAENVARFLDVNDNMTLGEGEPFSNQWAPLVHTTGDEELFNQLYDGPSRRNVLQFLAFDQRNPNSIVSCVKRARENARSVRENIPVGIWEQLNKFFFLVRSAAHSGVLNEPNAFCEQIKLASHVITGLTYSTMSHGEAWHFSRIGRLIERADKTSRIVDVQYYLLLPDADDIGTTLDVVRWSALLKSATALEMYRRVHGRIEPNKVADFLILDRQFPRSVHFCLVHAQNSLQEIAGSQTGTFHFRSEQVMGRLRAELDYTDIDGIIGIGMHEFIDDLQQRLNQVGEAIRDDFFTAANQEQATNLGATQTQKSS